MIGKKLRKMLGALDSTEFRRMRKLFQSPIYTTNPHHLILYDYIRQFYPSFESPRLKHETVFKKVYPQQVFDEKKLWNLVTEFTRLTEEYLVLLDNRKNSFPFKKQLTQIYGKRNLYDFFEKGTKALLTNLDALPYRDMNYYLQRAQLNEAWYFHPMKNKYDFKDTSLEDLMESLDKYFVLGKMRFGIAAKNVERVLSKTYDLKFLEAIEKERITKDNNTLFQLYHSIFELITKPKGADFEAIEKLLFHELGSLRFVNKQLLFYTCLNFINRQINIGKAEFNCKAFEWNQFGLTHDLFLENQIINEHIFGNIVVIACREKQFDWTEEFITSFQKYLNHQIRTPLVNYNLGLLYFYQKDYDKAISILSEFSYSSNYWLKTRLTLIRAAFEKFLLDPDYFSVFIYQAEALEISVIRNKKASTAIKKTFLAAIRILQKLAKKIMNNQSQQEILSWTRNQLASKDNVLLKEWILERIENYASFGRRN